MLMLDRAQSMLNRLNKAREAGVDKEEATTLDGLRKELEQLANPISQLSFNAKLLSNQGVKLSTVSEFNSAVETVRNVSQRFQEAPKSSTLKGMRWTSLNNKLKTLSTKSSEAQANDWKVFFSSNFFGGLPPNQRSAQLAPTPENKKALERYRTLYQHFNKYRSNIPRNTEEFDDLRKLSDQLAQIEFQEDVPRDVSKFFQAIGTGGASLEMLTPEVIDWLRSNNSLMNYVVRAKQI
ncbi:hypothetical protein U737_15180 [Methylomonas sp. LW13]|uniref:hypothetical protein n=1 Tax=unclassified Methylomonas TaxID=2608980 RepID=UPI00051BFC81|nr:hypothetical protein [Methylomonas sp. LW13]QBC28131.1 hypothetical protein U737_15180 [Methylomonas sp. LW13]